MTILFAKGTLYLIYLISLSPSNKCQEERPALQAKTINMQAGSEPIGNSLSLWWPISIHQREMPFTNPHNYVHNGQEVSMWTRPQLASERGVMSAIKLNPGVLWLLAALGCGQFLSCAPKMQRLPRTQRVQEKQTVKKSLWGRNTFRSSTSTISASSRGQLQVCTLSSPAGPQTTPAAPQCNQSQARL